MSLLHSEKKSEMDIKIRPISYWTTQGRFNLTALLQTGRFYLDETGLLVAPNGTRYRIPSGPPEGRKPLRPDRPNPAVDFSSTASQIDLFSNEQQDSGRSGPSGFVKSLNTQDGITLTPFQPTLNSGLIGWSRSNEISSKSNLLGEVERTQPLTNLMIHLDWNVILMTVILSSIALVCNLALVVLLSWKMNQLRKWSPDASREKLLSNQSHISGCVKSNSQFDQSNSLCLCTLDRVQNANDSTITANHRRHDIITSVSGVCAQNHMCPHNPLPFPVRMSRRYRHRHGRRRRHLNSNHGLGCSVNHTSPLYMNPKAQLTHTGQSLLRDIDATTPILRTTNNLDGDSSSGGSWHAVVSDGMISESTVDEAAEENNGDGYSTTGESATNSNLFYQLPRQIRTFNTVHRSGSTPNDIGRFYNQGRTVYNRLTGKYTEHPEHVGLDTIYSDRLHEDGCESSTTRSISTISNDPEQKPSALIPSICPNRALHVCHSIGIHFGLLGILLSLIQLIVVCSALSRRMLQSNTSANTPSPVQVSGSYLSELICVMATSLAADTLLCARQYILAAILLMFWTASYVAQMGLSNDRSPQKTISSFCLGKYSETGMTEDVNARPDKTNRQQHYAYLALTHSLPWAVAAGTALLCTFALPKSPTRTRLKLNLFFQGLESLLICQVDPRYPVGMTYGTPDLLVNENRAISYINFTAASKTSSYSSQNWLSWSLLILLPLSIQLVLCTTYVILIRFGMRRHQLLNRSNQNELYGHDNIMCWVLGLIFVLISAEFVSCFMPILWSILSHARSSNIEHDQTHSSPYVYRLIILHLLIDPWIIVCILQPIMIRLIRRPRGTCDVNLSKPSELIMRSRSTDSPLKTNPRNRTYHIDHETKHSNLTANLTGKSLPSVDFMGCLPISSCILNANSQGMASSANDQSMLMTYLPSTNFYVSPFQPLQQSNEMERNLFVPVDSNHIPLSPAQSNTTNLTRFRTDQGPVSKSVTFNEPRRAPIADSVPEVSSSKEQEVFPQLCEHHQKLLEQHYAVRLPVPVSSACASITSNGQTLDGQVRAFGQVPRLTPVTLNFTDSIMMKPVIRIASGSICSSSGANAMADSLQLSKIAYSHNPHLGVNDNVPNVDETGKHASLSRPPAGKSQATAAVMAAAAAAVAAQAGTMSRSTGEQAIPDSGKQQLLQSVETKTPQTQNHSNLSPSIRIDETIRRGSQS